MVRLRYKYSEDRLSKESAPVLLGTQFVTVVVDIASRKFTVLSLEKDVTGERTVVAEGTANSDALLTMKAKKTLKKLGVVFQEEIRRRGNTDETLVDLDAVVA